MDLNVNTVHISSQDQLTPSNIERWHNDGVKLIIIDGQPEPVPFKVSELMIEVNKYFIDKELQGKDMKELPSNDDIRFQKEQYRLRSKLHSRFNYKRK